MSVSYKRVALCYSLSLFLMFLCILRVYAAAVDTEYAAAAINERTRKIVLSRSRGTIFDCNMKPLTNADEKTYAIIFDEPQAITTLYNHFHPDEINDIVDEIRKNGFAVKIVSRKIEADGIYCFDAPVNIDKNTLAKHIIGYTDDQNHGISGLSLAFDSLLYSDKNTSVSFTLDGRGDVLQCERPVIDYDYATSNSGIKITIDKDIQQIAEQESLMIESGAVVVTEVSTGKIRAMVSRPDFDISNLAKAVESEDNPLLNRALSTYNIGSVFKPCVAAAGLDAEIDSVVNCVGYLDVDGLTFSCHKLSGHGTVGLSDAIKFSCNSFFYSFAQNVGASRIISVAQKAGFESRITLADGISAKKGSLGDKSLIETSARAVANLSIGQGAMMLSPLVIGNLYLAIANGGSYRAPSLVEGIIQDGRLTDNEPPTAEVRVMTKNTAAVLKTALSSVLEEGGTGVAGKPTLVSAAGKTGTAQTGIIRNGKKVTNSWFCGFFPLEEPKYAVTVLWENSAKGCGSVFAGIADAVTELQNRNDNT